MTAPRYFVTCILAIVLVSSAVPSSALNKEQEREMDRTVKLTMAELTVEARAALEKKYPQENWEAYHFPKFVFTSNAVEAGYKIAVKYPELLSKLPCYCFCDTMGHRNLAYCFLKDGKPEGGYDDHASQCNICYGEAMFAFLWTELGATDKDILEKLKKVFE
jgi:hypothetical protein